MKQTFDLSQVDSFFWSSPIGKKIFTPGVIEKKDLNSNFTDQLSKWEAGRGLIFKDWAKWLDMLYPGKLNYGDGPAFNYACYWAVRENGSVLRLVALPYGVHLKKNLSEQLILERINKINSEPAFGNFTGLAFAVYDKEAHEIYFKWSWGLPLPYDYLHYYSEVKALQNICSASRSHLTDLYEL